MPQENKGSFAWLLDDNNCVLGDNQLELLYLHIDINNHATRGKNSGAAEADVTA